MRLNRRIYANKIFRYAHNMSEITVESYCITTGDEGSIGYNELAELCLSSGNLNKINEIWYMNEIMIGEYIYKNMSLNGLQLND